MTIRYKALKDDMSSPFQGFRYEIGKTVVAKEFNDDPTIDCAAGLYATDPEGLLYSYRPGRVVVECEVSGRHVRFDQFKERWEKLRPLRILDEEAELKPLVQQASDVLDYNLYEAMWPVHPFRLEPQLPENAVALVQEWDSVRASVSASVWESVRDSVWDSVRDSVWDSVRASVRDSVWDSASDSASDSVWASVSDSVWDSVRDSVSDSVWDSVRDSVRASVSDSVWDSVRDSVRDSVWGYTSSLFPNTRQWKYIDHEPGTNPFQPAIDLWRAGIIPSNDGTTWRLHGHKDAQILKEIRL